MIIPGALIRRRLAGPDPGADPEVEILRAETIVISPGYLGPKDSALVPMAMLTAVRNNAQGSFTPRANVPAANLVAVRNNEPGSVTPRAQVPAMHLVAVRNYSPVVDNFTVLRSRVIIIS